MISTAFTVFKPRILFELLWFFPSLLTFYVVYRTDRKRYKQIIIVLISAASVISIYGIYQYFFTFKYALQHLVHPQSSQYVKDLLASNRIVGIFISPNILASYLIMNLFLVIGLLLNSLTLKKPVFWLSISLFVMIVTLLFTKSLGAILAFIISLVFFLIFSLHYLHGRIQDKKIMQRINLCMLAVLIIFMLIVLFFLKERLLQLIKISDMQNSIVQRLYYWKASLEMIKDYPLAGVGWRNFGFLYKHYKLPLANVSHYSHNVFLQIMVEAGPLGLISFSWIVLIFLRKSLWNLKNEDIQWRFLNLGIFCAGIAFLLHNLIDLTFYFNQASFEWWIILALLRKNDSST